MSRSPETKHEKFLRLMQKRLSRTLDEMRLVTQLSSSNYESFEEEHLEVVAHLANGVQNIANSFDVPFEFTVGVSKPVTKEVAALSQAKIKVVVDHLEYGAVSEALEILYKALPAHKAH